MVTTSPTKPPESESGAKPSSIAEIASGLRLAVARMARRLRQDAYEGEGKGVLSPTLTAALATVDRFGPLTPSELAERERVRRPTATRIVTSLADLGLVSRTPDPSDGRGSLVACTPDGRALLKRLRRRKDAYLARRMRQLEPDEVETLARASEILSRLLDEDADAATGGASANRIGGAGR